MKEWRYIYKYTTLHLSTSAPQTTTKRPPNRTRVVWEKHYTRRESVANKRNRTPHPAPNILNECFWALIKNPFACCWKILYCRYLVNELLWRGITEYAIEIKEKFTSFRKRLVWQNESYDWSCKQWLPTVSLSQKQTVPDTSSGIFMYINDFTVCDSWSTFLAINCGIHLIYLSSDLFIDKVRPLQIIPSFLPFFGHLI